MMYLAIEKAVEEGYKESLKGCEEMRRVGPERELENGSFQRHLYHVQYVGYA